MSSKQSRELRRHVVTQAAAAAVVGLLTASAQADFELQTSAVTVNTPWAGTTATVVPRVDTLNVYPSDEVGDAPGNYTNTVAENFFVTSETFKANSAFTLGQFDIVGSATAPGTFSMHLFDLGDLGATPVPANYNLSTINGGGPAVDLLGAGSGLSYTFTNGSGRNMIQFLLSGSDQAHLLANHSYALEAWHAQNQGGTNTVYWERLGGASQIPPDPNNYPNPYNAGDTYSNTSGTALTNVRGQINGAGRDLMMAIYDTSVLPLMQVDINGGATTQDLHPNQDDPNQPNPHGPVWRNWGALPTSGNNGSGVQNGYGTVDTITKQWAVSGIPNSPIGALKATIRSVDIYNNNGPAYNTDTPLLNSHDWSLPGATPARTFDNSGSYTPTKDYTYRDFVFAEIGNATQGNGTQHRLELKLEGLEPNTPYKLKFYSYDNTNPLTVQVFTDVTANPVIFMPNAFSADGNFTPGEGQAGTQWAPSGQYIDGYTGGAPTFPASDDFHAITLYATADGSGNLIFDQTTVTGLSGATQVLPVLNGFEILKDARTFNNGGGDGAWNNPSNWANSLVPNTKGQVANLVTVGTSTITIDAPTTLGRINFNNNSLNITGSGGNTLTLDDTSINSTNSFQTTGRTQINVNGGSSDQTISAALILKKDTQFYVNDAGTTLNLTNLQPATINLAKAGPGTVKVNNFRINQLRVNNGKIMIAANGSASGVSKAAGISIAASSRLDITNNHVITQSPVGTWNGTAYTDVTGLIKSGRGTGNLWDGSTGIITSQTAAVGSNFNSIGIAKGSEVKSNSASETALWAGQTITGTDTLVMYTYGGDATLDGRINIDDYVRIDSGIAGGYTGWVNGDFNYDGKINIDDYTTVIDANIGNQNGFQFFTGSGIDGSAGGGSGVAAVPEPASLALIALSLGAIGMRRRRGR